MAMSVDESSEPIAVKSPSSSTKKSKPSSKTNTSSGGASGKENKRPQIKRCNKWDSVMNKIAENKNARPTIHLREVKSKISTGLTNNNNGSSPTSRVRALNKVACSSVQSLNERSLNSQQLKAKSRRTRVRASESNLLQDDSQSDVSSNAAGNTVNSSPLSATPARSTPTSGVTHSLHQRQNTSSPRKPPAAAVQANNRAAKKRDVVRQTSTPPALSEHPVRHTKQAASPMRPVRPNNLLQKRGLSPASNSNAAGNVGNGGGGPPAEPKVPRKIISSKRPVSSAKSAPLKEHNRLPLSQTAVAAQANNNNNLKSSVQAAATAPCTPPSPAPQPPVTTIPEMCGTVATFPAKCEKMVAVAEKATAITAREIAILHKSNRGLEALGVLVQYLVYDLDAFACPSLKRAQRSTGISLMEARTNCARLEQQLADQILRHARDVSEKDRLLLVAGERAEERSRTLEGIITELTRERDNAYDQIMQMKKSHAEQFESIQAEFNLEKSETAGEIAFLRQTIEERCSEVRDNRKKLDEQMALLEDERNRCEEDRCMYEKELMKLQQSLSESENSAKSAERDAEKWRHEAKTIRVELENKLELLQHELIALRNKNAENEFNGPRTETNILKDEVESLRNVLELKQSELSELRKRNLELNRAAEQLPATQAKVQMLEARVEDLQVQLQRKMEDEKELHQRNKLLEESFHQEAKQKTRLSQYNEELQYRLKQNHEVVNVLAAMTGTTPEAALSPRKVLDYNGLSNNNSFYNDSGSTPNFVRSHSRNGSNGGRMSFNERYGSSERSSIKLERKHSFREKPDKYRTSSITVDRQLSNGSSPSHTNPRAYDRHNSSPAHDSSGQSSDNSFEGKPHNKSQDCCFEMEDLSPPASPQIKAVVEKSDSVSWVLEIAEPPEIVASRLVRRAGSFRNSTPPPKKNTSSPSHQSQQQSPPLLKRPRCNTGLTQRVVLNNEIARQNSDPTSARSRSNSITKLTRSASMGCAALNDSIVADWSNCGGSSTPYKSKQDSPSFRQNGEKESQILITCDTTVLTSRCDELCPTLPAHRSIISNQRADSPDSSVSDDSENSVDDCDKKSDENRMDGSWSEDGDTDI
ncbi:uncharacterized protein LOC113366246 isoform X2 [Ctenocephalides felis]|nr:uncharacterized protein LOC113366246 isoform X2 [Ctenocephalides felis]